MGLFNIFKSKKKRREEARVKDVLQRTDDTIARIEKGYEKMKQDDEAWKKIIGY